MPIYEYTCKRCSSRFEFLVLRRQEPTVCSSCGAAEIERLLSLPSVKSSSTHAMSMAAAKRRDKAQATDNAHEQAKYERSHND